MNTDLLTFINDLGGNWENTLPRHLRERGYFELFEIHNGLMLGKYATVPWVSLEKKHNTTLSYLLSLIKNGELKVGRWEKDSTFHELSGTAEEIVATIASGWKQSDKEPEYSVYGYEISVRFTLPNNPWPT